MLNRNKSLKIRRKDGGIEKKAEILESNDVRGDQKKTVEKDRMEISQPTVGSNQTDRNKADAAAEKTGAGNDHTDGIM